MRCSSVKCANAVAAQSGVGVGGTVAVAVAVAVGDALSVAGGLDGPPLGATAGAAHETVTMHRRSAIQRRTWPRYPAACVAALAMS